jgi:AbrB family looped-hinge helix DNA binding protein
MKTTVSVSPKGQITLPSDLRKKYGIEPGGLLNVEETGGKLVLTPAVAVELEMYSDEDIARWAQEGKWKPGEKDAWKRRWGLKNL